MKPYKQLNQHMPNAGEYGDCLRTCIACLLEREPITVPNFASFQPDDGEKMWIITEEWLHTQGYGSFVVLFPGDATVEQIGIVMKVHNPGCYYMLAGSGLHGGGHVVIGLNDTIVHDPSWHGTGLIGPDESGAWMVIVLVPSLMKHQPALN